MSPVVLAALASWRFDPRLAVVLGIVSVLYIRGWRSLHRRMPQRFRTNELVVFHAGLATLYVAIASPLDAFAGLLLQLHMVQHLLLMIVAPALLLLGAPVAPLLRGLPATLRKSMVGPLLRAPEAHSIGGALTHPVTCFVALSAATWFWHTPGPYQLALRSPFWHEVEHASFLAAGLLFWWPVIVPWPSRERWPRWTVPAYLLLADVQNTALAAIFVFSDRTLYPIYAEAPRLAGLSAQQDQVAAGLLMWIPMSLAFLVPAVVVTVRLLSPPRSSAERRVARRLDDSTPAEPRATASGGRLLPASAPSGRGSAIVPSADAALGMSGQTERGRLDLLRLPYLGPLLRAGATRRALQIVLLLVAAAVIADGLFGPQMSAMNLAGVLPWTYWRAFTVIALLAAGNFFCMACPFTLPRAVARRLGARGWAWPRALRTKWIAVALLLAFFCAYEVFDVWDRPAATAWLLIAYFAAALAVDALFRGASFCKYVCPIGQFHFVQSLVSPFEVAVRSPSLCSECTTHDCLRGGSRGRGCETDLFLPRKSGNLDCTFCLDCARACPHDNVGLLVTTPGRELWRDPDRSSLGRLSRRLDVAFLAVFLVAASLVGAASMIAPVASWQAALALRLGVAEVVVTGALLLVGIAVVPAASLALATSVARRATAPAVPMRELFCRFALALVPLGASLWTAHFLFHLGMAWASAAPAVQRAATDVGIARWDPPIWMAPPPLLSDDAMLALQIVLLDGGLLLALYSLWRVATSLAPRALQAIALLLPPSLLAVALYAIGVWVFLQPMEMRGMMMGH